MIDDEKKRLQALSYLQSLSTKQFTQFFYDAVDERNTSDCSDWKGHLVLADAEQVVGEPWNLDFLALADLEKYNKPWNDDIELAQQTVCAGCGYRIRSWAKYMICPVCQTSQYGT